MTIEQKAKRYDEALWKAGELYQPSYSALLEEIFPELIKYNDEKVRGAIIHFISHTPTVPKGRIDKKTMLAWLEKQKTSERNSDWSDEDEKVRKMLIKFFGNGAFFDSSTNGIPDKDIVAWLEKQSNNPYNGVSFEYNGNTWGMCARDNGVDILLNRELIQHVSIEKQGEQNPIMAKSPQLGEQKPAWSEEDEKMCQETIDWFEKKCFPYALENENPARKSIRWLKSLKDRVQPKQEWSEEDALRLEEVICMVEANGRWVRSDDAVKSVLDWLKSLEDRYTWKPSEKQIDALEHFVRSIGESGYASPYDNNTKLLYSLLEQLKKL